MVRSSASHLATVTTDCHSRSGAKQLYGVHQPSLAQRPIVTDSGDAPETSPFRTTGYSKRWLDPTRGDRLHRQLAEDSRPRSNCRPGTNGVGSV